MKDNDPTQQNIPTHITHDKFFKYVFSKKEAVADFVDKLLPKNLSKRIDLDSLELDNTEYVDDKLKTHCSDVVYNASYVIEANELANIKIAILFEHKSQPEKYPHLQLLRYLINLWETQVKQKQALTPVIPIIFYHGKRHWQYQQLPDYFNSMDDSLKQFLPNFDYVLLDTSNHDNDYFKKLDSSTLQSSILTMKYIFNINQLLDNLTDVFSDIDQLLDNEQGRKFFEVLAIYLYNNSMLSTKEWGQKMQTVSAQAEKQFQSTADRLIAQGRQEGRDEGLQKGIALTAKSLKNMGFDWQSISKATGLSEQEIEML